MKNNSKKIIKEKFENCELKYNKLKHCIDFHGGVCEKCKHYKLKDELTN